MKAFSGIRLRIIALLLLLTVPLLSGCTETETPLPAITLRYRTAIERRATLSILKQSWEDRPMEINNANKWYEHRLLNRIGFYGRKVVGTETFRPASQFWLDCLHEHQTRYDE